MGRTAEKHPFGGRVHRPEFLVGLLEPAVQVLGHPELMGHLPAPRRGFHPRTQHHQVRGQGHFPAQKLIRHPHRQGPPLGRGHPGRPRRLKGNERHPLLLGLGIVTFPKTIGPQIPVEDGDLHQGIAFLEQQGVLEGLGATHPAAIGVLRLPGPHALNHHQAPHLGQSQVAKIDPGLQLPLGEHPGVRAIEIAALGPKFPAAGGHHDDAVGQFPLLEAVHGGPAHRALKLPHVPFDPQQFGLDMHFNVGVVVDRGLELVEEFLGVRAFQGKKQLPGQAPESALPFHQIGVKTLVRQGQCGAQAGHPASQHQGPGHHRKSHGIDGRQPGRPADRHGDDIPRLGQGRRGFFLMHPGALLPYIGEREVARIEVRTRQDLPEHLFVGPGAARGHHHPVEPQGPDGLPHPGGGFHRAGKQVVLHVDDPGQLRHRRRQLGQVDGLGDIGAAVTEKHPDPGRKIRRPAGYRLGLGGPGAAGGGQQPGGHGRRGGGGGHGCGNVHGLPGGAAHQHPWPGGGHRDQRRGFEKPVFIEFHPQPPGQGRQPVPAPEPHRQHRHIKGLLPGPPLGVGEAHPHAPLGPGGHRGHPGADQADAVRPGLLQIVVIALALGP